MAPASQAIAIGCFATLGVALVLLAFGLRPRPGLWSPGVWVIGLSTALVLTGVVVADVVDLRITAISLIYGQAGPGSSGLFASWSLVEMAGVSMAVVGFAGLITTAAVAVIRLRNVVPRS